jgi:polysaccharide export outer membrane protein
LAGSRALLVACALLADHSASSAPATPDASSDTGTRTGEIVIGLPQAADHDVSFTFGDGKVSLVLPAGATFPLDFARESNSLVRSGEVVPVDATHVRLDLKMASGVVDRIDVSTKAVVIKLRRRFAESREAASARDDDYRLGSDDKIQVSINGDPKLTQQVVIGPDGRASLPLVGDVSLGGLTMREARETVTELLARDYLVDPKVDLQIIEYKSRWVMVTGEVGKAGRVALRGGATLKDALADADGLTVGAGDEIIISRDAPQGDGKIQIPVDRQEFERAVVNPPLKTGDIVSVPSRPYVYVQGEVRQASKVPLERGMTLMKAISVVGGLTEWASESKVQIISEGSTGQKRLFNLKDIRALRVPDPPLKGGDVIYVRRRFL